MADDDPWEVTYFHRAIQTSIGRALRAQFDLSEPVPEELATLLQRLDEATGSQPQSPPNPSAGGSRQRC